MLANRTCSMPFPYLPHLEPCALKRQKRPNVPRLETCSGSAYIQEAVQQGHTQRSEEPPVLAAGVSVLQSLLDGLLGLLTLGDLLESVLGDNALETLQFEGVASRHQVVVVDDLDEGLDTAALLDQLLAHASGDLGRVALDSGNDGVREWVRLGAIVVRLDNDDLFGAEASSAFYPARLVPCDPSSFINTKIHRNMPSQNQPFNPKLFHGFSRVMRSCRTFLPA